MNSFFIYFLLTAFCNQVFAFRIGYAVRNFTPLRSRFCLSSKVASDDLNLSCEVVIIGSGLAGLSCGALLAHTGHDVVVIESHDVPGGCAHGWERLGYHFESGPSLYSGFSIPLSPNPLKNVFQIIQEEPEWITYDRWGTVLPEGIK